MATPGARQYQLVKDLSFVRYGGTPAEEKAAARITDEITRVGGSYTLMPFTIPAFSCETCTIDVTAPYAKSVPALPYGRSGSIDGEYRLYYASRGVEEDYLGVDSLENTVVMLDEMNLDVYRLLVQKGASAFIILCGKYYDTPKTTDLLPRSLRAKQLEIGKIPGFMIRAKDAMELVRRGAKSLRLHMTQTEYEATSHNILAEIPGTACPEEVIILTAHYDSVQIGTGSWDNATGSANLAYLYGYFLQHPTRRTLRFLWCGSEEQGLLGSRAYVEQNPDKLPAIKMCFNFDMCGTILGFNNVIVSGGEDLRTYAEQFCHEMGWSASIRTGVHSSDSAPFADKGIPGLGLCRRTYTAEIHTRYDLLDTISAAMLQDMGEFSSALIARVANSMVMPVKTGMPEDMLKELDRYFQRDKK